MNEQLGRMKALVPGRDLAFAPAGIDAAIWDAVVPGDNKLTSARVALGKKLYFDTRLSKDGTVACATCHDVSRGFTDQRPVSEGIGDRLGQRNAPTTMNALLFEVFFLDGRAPSLEEQAKLPILNAVEMGQPNPQSAMSGIEGDAEYRKMFQEAYGRPPSYDDLGRAIAAFERTLVFVDSPFDRYLAGDEGAVSESAKRGWALFNGKARCATCHMLNRSLPVGTDNRFHNIGVAARKQNFEELTREALKALASDDSARQVDQMALQTKASELGRFLVTRNQADIGAFKTLQIRNVGVTPPYMHDGSMRTLWDVMDHYNKGGEANPFLDGGIEPLALSEAEIDDMVEWMFALTDARLADQNRTEKQKQRQISTQRRPFRDDAMASRKVLPFEALVQRRGAGGSPAGRAQETEAGKPGAASGSGPSGKASAGKVESSGSRGEE